VVDPYGFLEKKSVSIAEEEQHGACAIEKSDGNEEGEYAKDRPVNVKSVPRPGMDPGKSVIFEQKAWLEPIVRDPVIAEVLRHMPHHKESESDPEKNQ